MVLEHLIATRRLERTPHLILIMAFVFVSIAVLLTTYFYPKDHGMVVILLTIMPAIPFFLNFIRHEERRHEVEDGDPKRHSLFVIYKPLILLYLFYFIGTSLSFGLWFSALPQQQSDHMFSDVKDEYHLLRSAMSGNFLESVLGGGLTGFGSTIFGQILGQNLLVLSLMIIFSFIYSIGSIFLLTWNAALLGVFIEHSVREFLPTVAVQFGATAFPIAFAAGAAIAFLSILPHGIFEISAFFIASLGGGILSTAFERGTYRRRAFIHIIRDAFKLLLLAVVLLIIGAVVESVYFL
jgi:uncharacterized membrane protein SpoIIM required for sporulation